MLKDQYQYQKYKLMIYWLLDNIKIMNPSLLIDLHRSFKNTNLENKNLEIFIINFWIDSMEHNVFILNQLL
jgi:hypothetical protein